MVILLLMCLIFSSDAFTGTINEDEREFTVIIKSSSISEVLPQLKYCHQKGNLFCSMALCDIYFNMKDFASSHLICLPLSKIIKSHEIEFKLGYMLSNGLGVLQDKNEALKHYIKSASLGNSYSAFNISQIFRYRIQLIVDSNLRETLPPDEVYEDVKLSFAWLLVSYGMGYSSTLDGDGIRESLVVRGKSGYVCR